MKKAKGEKNNKVVEQEIKEKEFDVFLKSLAEWPNIKAACEASGLSRSMTWRRRQKDPEFRERFEEAWALGIQAVEDHCIEQAKKNHVLMIFMLKALNPEKYKERSESKSEVTLKAEVQHLVEAKQRYESAKGLDDIATTRISTTN